MKYYVLPDGTWMSNPVPKAKDGVDQKELPVPQLNEYQRATLAENFGAEWVDIVLLGLYTILFFTGAYVSFLRYDVR